MEYSKMDLDALEREQGRLEARYDAIEDDCIKKGLPFEKFEELVHEEATALYMINKYKRLLQDPTVEYGKEWKGEILTLDKFKAMALDGTLIDNDGIGYYATESAKSDVEIYPSDVKEGLIRDDFSHVIWFNK